MNVILTTIGVFLAILLSLIILGVVASIVFRTYFQEKKKYIRTLTRTEKETET